jgi:preprotein translocase subunit SecA
MLDEATTPLVISGCDEPLSRSPAAYVEACRVGRLLSEGTDFTIDRDAGRVWLTDTGLQRAAAEVDADALQSLCRPWPNYVERALVAELLLQRDCEYIVKGDKIVLVDEFTGRLFSDRTLRDGVHQAVQAKEGLPISAETQPVAHISRQRFLRLYRGLCGMTGTATGSERELRRAYGVNVTAIPTRLPCKREVYPTRYFATEAAKWNAIALEIARLHATDRPVLVGTRTIDASEKLAARLRLERLPFQLLNGRDDAVEAGIISRAGQTGTITIATNLAGRGTDIKLGQGVAQLGGLHVIGTERHESARVDRQLIGRSARQGDPGSCQFFVSAEDHLITHYGPWLGQFMKELGSGEIARDLSRKLRPVQKHAERLAYALRARLLKQDRWQQRVLDQLASEDRS